tara:strand:- start:319 stop:900 length:582 start_codon:yes stop_codon:yes gene_type:complete
VEKKSFNNQINKASRKVYANINDSMNLSQATESKVSKSITCSMTLKKHEMLSPSQIKQNNNIINNNNKLLRKAFSLCVYIVGLIIVIFSIIRPNIICMNSLGSIVKYIGMMIVVVALTELTYLELFASEYQSVNANVIEKQLYTEFGEKMNLTNSSGVPLKTPGVVCAAEISPDKLEPSQINNTISQMINNHV